MKKVDLHTHSVASPDGGITAAQYKKALENNLDCIAITDHNRIDFATSLQQELGADKIIVGEEISTKQGDIIGLFLSKRIIPGKNVETVVNEIKEQGGIIYVPHPFETVRNSLKREELERISDYIDIIESANGRAYVQNFGPDAHAWARLRNIPGFASSDAHRAGALGKTYTLIPDIPTANNVKELVKHARKFYERPAMLDILAPKMNRFLKGFIR